MRQATTRPAESRRSGRGPTAPPGHLLAATVEWVRKAAGPENTSVQVLLPGEDDRLHVLAASGGPVQGGRLRSNRRRQVLRTGRAMRIALRGAAGRSLAMLPLIADGETIGVVEIVAPTMELDGRRGIIDDVVNQSAIVFRSVREKRASDSALRTTAAELRLAVELLRAETPAAAVKSGVRLCFESVLAPVAGLLPDRSGTGWYVAAAYGLGSSRRAELRRSVDEVSVLTPSSTRRPQLAERFASIVGWDDADAIEAGGAILLVPDTYGTDDGSIQTAASLLGEALERLGTLGWAQLRNENLDLAIAWTAHELKGPLVGARAALAQITVADSDPGGRELLRQTRDELQQLADLVDPLLRWSAGSGPLRMRRTDLVRIVGDAVGSCRLGCADRSVIFDAPNGITIRADERELRVAIANVVRNALAYSSPSAPVTVVVDAGAEVARVRVRDRGPGVLASERHLIFDPFARGTAADARRGGKGLGLFISRRVVEAHGGTIGLRPVRAGAEFCIELPLAGGEGSLSAS